VEIEILGSMAQGGREKHQILPLFHDPQTLHQSHYEVGRLIGKHHVNSLKNSARDIKLLQGYPLRTQCGPYFNNREDDPKYPNSNHPGPK
jgi:hypothetical protein